MTTLISHHGVKFNITKSRWEWELILSAVSCHLIFFFCFPQLIEKVHESEHLFNLYKKTNCKNVTLQVL